MLDEPKGQFKDQAHLVSRSARVHFWRAVGVLLVLLGLATAVALWVGYRRLDPMALRQDPIMRHLFLRLRLPRVVLAGIVGASLGAVGAALQALLRNPLADPFTLGVSGGGTLGASVAIALGWGASLSGVPLVFLASFVGAATAVVLVYRISRAGTMVFPGTILLAGVVMNLIAGAGVVLIQYLADYTRALQILRWTIGSLDVVGFGVDMAHAYLPGARLAGTVTFSNRSAFIGDG